MAQWMTMVGPVAAIFSIVFIGAVVRRLNWLTQEADETLIRVVVRVLVPALILDVIVGNPSLHSAANLVTPPLVGFLSVVLGVVVALLVGKMFGPMLGMDNSRQVRTFAACIGLYNYGYIPIPLTERFFDPGTLGVLFVHNLGVEFAMWTVVIFVFQGGLTKGWAKRLISAPLLAIVAAVLLNAAEVNDDNIPTFLAEAVTMLGECAIPVALILVGATIADYLQEAKLTTGVKVMGAACMLRLGLVPLLFVLAAKSLPVSGELSNVMLIEAAMPAGAFPIILAKHYGGDVSTAVRIVLATSVVSLITMPWWLSATIGV